MQKLIVKRMKRKRKCTYNKQLFKNKIQAFTLLECLFAMALLPAILLVFSILITSVQKMSNHWRDSEEKNWHLFVQQMDYERDFSKKYEIVQSQGKEILQLRYFDEKDNKEEGYQGKIITYSLNEKNEFVRSNNGGFEPILHRVQSVKMQKVDSAIQLTVKFQSGKVQFAQWKEKNELWSK